MSSKAKGTIGILTAGGDCPGLNAVIRGVAVRNFRRLKLVCLGGNGTQKTALRLHEHGGINVLTLPKTIDNDVAETDITFGFDSAMAIATEAIDRLLCTRFGTKAGELLAQGRYNIMVGLKGDRCVPVPLSKVAGIKRTVPPGHPWITTARLVETCLGDLASRPARP